MQIKKDNIRNSIIREAQKIFLEKGYENATVRGIAKKTRVVTSNMYNYFKNKDDIFATVVEPTITEIKKAFDIVEERHSNLFEKEYRWSFEWHEREMDKVVDFIDAHRTNLHLILFKSHGSSIYNFKEYIIERYTDIFDIFIKTAGKRNPEFKDKVSKFFIHNISSFYINVVSELVMHDVPYKEMKRYMKEIVTFTYYGNKELMNWELLLQKQ